MHSEAIFLACWRTAASEDDSTIRSELEDCEPEDKSNTGRSSSLLEEDPGSGSGVGGTGFTLEEEDFFVLLLDEDFSTAAALEEDVPELEDFSFEEELTEDFFDEDERVDLLLEDFAFCDEEPGDFTEDEDFTEDDVSVLDSNSSWSKDTAESDSQAQSTNARAAPQTTFLFIRTSPVLSQYNLKKTV